MAFPQVVQLKPGNEKVTTTTKRKRYAEEGYMFPGRWFRYALAGEALTVGNLHTSISATAAHDLDITPVAAITAGDTTVQVASLTIAADEYADGFLIFNDVEEEGHQYLIKGNTAATTATTTITIDEEDGFATASTTAQQMGLVHSNCFDVVIYPTTPTGPPVGCSCVDWADNAYGWLQFRGPGNVDIYEGTAVTSGDALMPSLNTAGALELFDKSNDTGDYGVVAWMGNAVGVSAEASAVQLVLP